MAIHNVKDFTFSAEAEKSLIPAWKDYVTNYRALNFSTKKPYSQAKTLEEKEMIVNAAIAKEVDKLAGVNTSVVDKAAYATNPVYRWANNAVINKLVDTVVPDILTEDFLNVAEVVQIGYGDSAEFDIKSSDLFYVSKTGNSRRHVEAQRQFTGHTSIPVSNHVITTETDMYRVLAGKESPAEYAMKVVLSIEAEIAKDIMAAITSSFTTLTANFKENSYDEKAFQKLATRVTAANGGARAVAMGTDLALSTVLPSNEYLKMGLGEDYTKVGYLPVFKKVPLIGLSQKIDWTSEDYDFALPDNMIYFISPGAPKLVKIVIEGGSLTFSDDFASNGNLTQVSSLHKRFGVGIVTAAKYGIMKVSL